MPRILQFTRFALRDALVTFGPLLLAVAALGALAYWLVDPTPPKTLTLLTGQENSAYERFGKTYAERLRRQGIKLELRPSQGSMENLQRLSAGKEGVDVAFVQGGMGLNGNDEEETGLRSLGSLFTEPVWLFHRSKLPLKNLTQLKGLRVNLGSEGSGVPQLFGKLLEANGMNPGDVKPSALENTPATVELLEGRLDALVFVSAPDAPLVQMLLQTPGVSLFDFTHAEAYSRRFPFLTHVTLPRGIVDLGRDLPSRDFQLIAPTATLLAREDLHPALVDLLVQAAVEVHGGSGWFRRQGEFPNPRYSEYPLARDAEKFYKNGPPLLQHYLPFWLANFFDRMWVVIVALGALLLPASKVVPPLYVWRIRSRIFKWYGQLRTVELAVDNAAPAMRGSVCVRQLQRLAQIEEQVNRISVPLAFATELYGLRSHVNFVRERLLARNESESRIDAKPTEDVPG